MSAGAKTEAPRVFISYSHDSPEHSARVLALADRLTDDGIDVSIDQYELEPEDGWERWMVDQIEDADRVLAICTETYRRRFEGKETEGGLGGDWEGAILTGKLYRRHKRFVSPVVFDAADLEHLPTVLKQGATYHVLADEKGYEGLLRVITGQHATPRPKRGKLKTLKPRPRPGLFERDASSRSPQAEPADGTAITAYRAWARERYASLEMLGLGAGELKVALESIYVPLRIHDRPHDEPELGAGKRGRAEALESWVRAGRTREILIEELPELLDGDGARRHALIFGEAGSGKTTALKKLHQRVLSPRDAGTSAPGLAPGTLPVFLRLRRLTPERLEQGLEAFVAAELDELSGGNLSEETAAELWARRQLLLLLDGLDEIADEAQRARALERIGWWLGEPGNDELRAIVSCRHTGWTAKLRELRLPAFLRLDVRPFDDEQIAQLIERWFREVGRTPLLDEGDAAERAAGLLRALADPELREQGFLKLISKPLLATLLCVVVMRGGEIPRRRVEFYERCLAILLREWRARQARRKPPVEPERAQRLLEALAWRLHLEKRRDDLAYVEALAIFNDELEDARLAGRVFRWLLDDVALLETYTDRHYGFAHLGFQEHLAARHVESRRSAGDEQPLATLCKNWDESWWHEVIRLFAGLPGGRGFGPLMRRLLAGDAPLRRNDLLAACLAEASDPDLEPFYALLAGGTTPERKEAALKLLRGRSEPRLLELATELAADDDDALAWTAEQVRAAAEAPESAARGEVFLLHAPQDHRPARRLARELARRAVETDLPGSVAWTAPDAIDRLIACPRVLVLLGSEPFDAAELETTLALAQGRALLVSLPGDPQAAPSDMLGALPHSELPSFDDRGALDALAARLRALVSEPERPAARRVPPAAEPATPESLRQDRPFNEPMTGEVFLPVPAGRFEMGGTSYDDEQPIHWVRLSPFWLARTPVTNRQYQLFLEATGHDEPEYWRDDRFSDPEQPVVGVSWLDAVAYCQWLSRESPLGLGFELPTEAQWEYAARGSEGREYPWGSNREPDAELANFGGNLGKPSPVGSHPAGAGPFDHLDLAGNVWEWCRDLWEPSYERWKGEEPLDPIGEADDSRRPLRGGSWIGAAVYLRSAYRLGDGPGFRYDGIGFRVSCSSSSTVR